MSLPAASAPVAVLVLAWDETTPAVRALVAAAETPEPALDSVVVLVPAGPATEELTQEEFLPIEASIDLPAAELLPVPLADEEPAIETRAEAAPATSPESEPEEDALSTTPAAPALAAIAASALPSFSDTLAALPVVELPALAGSTTNPSAPGWQGVRVLRLSNYSLATLAAYAQQALPAPAWTGAASFPASPYLGSSAVGTVAVAGLSPVADTFLYIAASGIETMPALALPAAQPALTPWEVKAANSPAAEAASPAYLPAELPAALDAESDTVPPPTANELVPTTEASTTELSEEVADELKDTFTVDVTPVQAGWSDALASLQAPADAAEHTAASQLEDISSEAAATSPEPTAQPVSALSLAAQKFDAPNLNFQIIQYARFAVPLALAEPLFDVIYAPAWPTWLAAQELRYRTGRPLVLHVTNLAATEDEPIDLAAGWVAEIQRQALHRADLILTETPALAARLRHELALPPHRVRAVPAADADAVALALRTAQLQ